MFSELTRDNMMTNLNQIGNPVNEKLGGLTYSYTTQIRADKSD